MAMQSPQHIMPMPHRPRKSPTPKSGTEKWGKPTHRARPPPATISRMPRQSSMPWGSGISGGPPHLQGTDLTKLSCSYSRKCTSAAASLQEREGAGGGCYIHSSSIQFEWGSVRMCLCARARVWRESRGQHKPKTRSTRKSSMRVRASPPRHGCRTHRSSPHTPTGSRRPADARSKGFTISLPSSSQTFCPLTKPAWRRLPESRGRRKKTKTRGTAPAIRAFCEPAAAAAPRSYRAPPPPPGFRGDRRFERSSAEEPMCVLLNPQLACSSSSGSSGGAVRK